MSTSSAGPGAGAGFDDEEYSTRGASVVDTAAEVFALADLIVKVKEPLAPRAGPPAPRPHPGSPTCTSPPTPTRPRALMASGATAIAYESVTDRKGRLPLLAPMSQVAGRLAIQAGARCLEASAGGRGVLLGGVPGVAAAPVTVIGGGVVGTNAVEMALGLGADVTVLDRDAGLLELLAARFGPALRTLYSSPTRLAQAVYTADLVIGAVLLPGAPGAPPDHRPDGESDAARHGNRRCSHRPGRLRRDVPAHHPRRPHLHRPRRRPLLRGQHCPERSPPPPHRPSTTPRSPM